MQPGESYNLLTFNMSVMNIKQQEQRGALTHKQVGVSSAVTAVQRDAVKFAKTLIFKSRP